MVEKEDNEDLKHSLNNILKLIPNILCKGLNFWLANLGESQHSGGVVVHLMTTRRPTGKPFFQRLDLITYPMNSRIRQDLQYLIF